MQIQQVWAIDKKNAAATCIPAIDQNIQKPSPTNTMESLNHVATTLRSYAKLRCNYAAIAAAAWVEDTFSKKCLKRVSRYNGILADILCQSGTLSGILAIHSDMLSGILAGIRSGILATHSDICRHSVWHSVCLADGFSLTRTT